MLSTRLGYGRPAFFAARFAVAFCPLVSVRCPAFFGAAFFHGAFFADAFFAEAFFLAATSPPRRVCAAQRARAARAFPAEDA
jgi:hypothetical protein